MTTSSDESRDPGYVTAPPLDSDEARLHESASVAANSRMIFAFSRDGALPFSSVWREVGTTTRLPNNAVWPAAVAVGWVAIITVLFMPSATSPVTAATSSYTPVAVMAVLGFAGIWWLVSARKWFTGPRRQGSIDELIELEAKRGG